MRRRIRRLTGDNDTGYINTFQRFCVSVLQEDAHALLYPKSSGWTAPTSTPCSRSPTWRPELRIMPFTILRDMTFMN